MSDANQRKGMGVLAAAFIGAVLGAAAVILAHKDTREKIQKRAKKLIQAGQEKTKEAKEKAAKEMEKAKEKVKES
jgi:hypothetical protein